ncbi:hypothetical protein POF53_08320 [Mitsuaria sp. RG]|nr:hypothetical protein [Mitsuaria sp. RG]
MGWRTTFLVTALVGIPVLLAQIFLLPRLTPDKAIRISDLPALFVNPKQRGAVQPGHGPGGLRLRHGAGAGA